MSDKQVPEYTRQDLRKASRFVEGEYRGINPREFYRRLKRRLEEFQTENDFKYETQGTQRGDLNILSESVGEKTGRVEGRMSAESDWALLGTGSIEYRPYGPYGAMAIVIGLLLAVVGGLADEIPLAVVGVLGVVGGIVLYFQTETGEFPVARRDTVRVLLTGEVSEREIADESETRTDIFANMTVTYAGDTFVNAFVDRISPSLQDRVTPFEDLSWTLRRAVVTQVKEYHDRLVVEDQQYNPSTGFFYQLSGFTDRDVGDHRQTINYIQSRVNDSFALRMQYNELLLDQLGQQARSNVDEQLEEINDELKELAEDMDVYVEREGLARTD